MNEHFLMGHQANIQQDIRRQFTSFLEQYFQKSDKIDRLLESNRKTYVIDSNRFFYSAHDLATQIFQHYYKYEGSLNQVFTQFVHEYEKKAMYRNMQDIRQDQESSDKFQIAFSAGIDGQQTNIGLRDLISNRLGKLVSLRGTVTRTTEVRPQLIAGIFQCTSCKAFSKKIVQQFRYTQPRRCTYDRCDSKNFELIVRKSEFADFQKLRVQQEPGSIPAGGMPRSIDVILRNDNVEKGQPGDICTFVGYLCVVPQMQSLLKPGQRTKLSTLNVNTRGKMAQMDGVMGVKGFRQLNYRYIFISTHVIVQNNQFNQKIESNQDEQGQQKQNEKRIQMGDKPIYSESQIYNKISKNLTESEIQMVRSITKSSSIINDVAESLFPSIFGHLQIKKALLLQLLGGIHKVTSNKINIRGDINILIVGDPSTAKSQFLKCINKFVPRSVYTNGKTTSAAGLTASVSRDQNGNVSIEAGALMLADNGICCIDEFDKMESKDQTAIHEAMQQQTISIAKAGVHATLNARASILAAANPVFGRYDKSKSLKNNLNLSAPIMSRFDLYFVICDEANPYTDHRLCEFLIGMHRNISKTSINQQQKYDHKTLRLYISLAKKLKPALTIEAAEKLRDCYRLLRMNEMSPDLMSYRPTVRQLESLIRLSQAYARLHFCLAITKQHVQQVYKLIKTSIIKLEKPVQIEADDAGPQEPNQIPIFENDRNKQKKKKTIELTYDHFERVKKSLQNLFKNYQKSKKQNQQDFQAKLSQQNIINYIIAEQLQKSDSMNSASDYKSFKKIAKAIIKKFIVDQRVLMIVQDNQQQDLRLLAIHPNYRSETY